MRARVRALQHVSLTPPPRPPPPRPGGRTRRRHQVGPYYDRIIEVLASMLGPPMEKVCAARVCAVAPGRPAVMHEPSALGS